MDAMVCLAFLKFDRHMSHIFILNGSPCGLYYLRIFELHGTKIDLICSTGPLFLLC